MNAACLSANRLLSREEAAEYLGVKPQTLAVWAITGRYQLPMVRVGRRVKYRQGDLDSWLKKRTVTHTSQAE
jgi:excisionase family DNA binding protein